MSIDTDKFIRKVRPVEAVRVTEDNLQEVAVWCGGLVVPINGLGQNNTQPYIHVTVRNPRRDSDSQAYPGMWIIREDYNNQRGLRVVNNKQFKNSYDSYKKPQPVPTGVPSPATMPVKRTAPVPTPTQVGAVEVVPGTAPEAGSSLTTGKASVPNIVEAAAAAGVIDANTAAEARGEIADLEAHNAVARDIAAAEVDGDMVQLGQPVGIVSATVVDELCDECGSPANGGVCTANTSHIVNSAAQIDPTV